jgi:hypothetical protein
MFVIRIVPSACDGGWHARANGFNLHAGLVVPAGQRDRLERGVSRCAQIAE